MLGDRPEVQLGERPDEAEDRRDGGQERRAQEEAGRRPKVQGAGSVTFPDFAERSSSFSTGKCACY